MNLKLDVVIKVRYVLVNPRLFVKMKESGDAHHKYDDDCYYLWGKYPVVTDSNVTDIEFKFDFSLEDNKK